MKKSLLIALGIILLSLRTINAQVVDYLYPVNELYGTGYWSSGGKVDGDIDLTYPNVGWAVFDLSILPAGTVIQSIKFYGYIDSTNFPQWSSTPMGIVNPLVDSGPDIYDQIITGYGQNISYIYVDEWSSFTLGWHIYDLGNSAVPDLQAAVNSSQGWFAIGFIVRNFSPGNYLIFAGNNSPNIPWLRVTYQPTPVELTSFRADVQGNRITLNWKTATEKNNRGFEIERKSANSSYQKIGFAAGYGTTTEPKNYSYQDYNVSAGSYTYRLKQIDLDGNFVYSKGVDAIVDKTITFSLLQNYPNPFNPATRISYSIPQTGYVSIKVYDILGREVATLVNEQKPAGKYEVTFDASKLSRGISAKGGYASGVYFYQLRAVPILPGGRQVGRQAEDLLTSSGQVFVQTKKMILVK